MKKYTLALLIAISFLSAQMTLAQEKENWSFGVYTGITSFDYTDKKALDFIRGGIENGDGTYVYAETNSWMAGINVEKNIYKNLLTTTLGLHYRNAQSNLDPQDYNSTNFMMINISEGTQNANYIRVTEIDQNLNYIGTQLNLKYHILRAKHNAFSFYTGIGVDLNLLFQKKMNIDFYTDGMTKYKNNIERLFESPSTTYGNLNLLFGLAIGKNSKTHGTIEIGPGFNLFGSSSSFVSTNETTNFQINIFLPFN